MVLATRWRTTLFLKYVSDIIQRKPCVRHLPQGGELSVLGEIKSEDTRQNNLFSHTKIVSAVILHGK